MATAADPLLITVKEYQKLPERNDVVQELHWGQVVTLTRPKMGHTKLQYRLVELLRPIAEPAFVVTSEFPFRALPEYDLRTADVAMISLNRWDSADIEDNLHGSPELVIEVLSPSNTKAEIREKAALCLSTGGEEFWAADVRSQAITVTRRSGETAVYRTGERIPLAQLHTILDVTEILR